MRLVFLGDISTARPHGVLSDDWTFLRQADLVIANLEGPIAANEQIELIDQRKRRVLYNSPHVLGLLESFHVDAVCLANNHLYDLPGAVTHTKELLTDSNIGYFGAGSDLTEASTPLRFSLDDSTVALFAFGWDVIGCEAAGKTEAGVNPFTPERTLSTVRRLRRHDQRSLVIFIFHWNYELEIYPQPAHRQLARDLIDEGVDAVIGLHPHVAQGGELFHGKPIAYSLGNWFFPVRRFAHFRLAFPSIASRQLALALEVEGGEVKGVRFHWYQFDAAQSVIQFERTEEWDGTILRELTPYAGMSHREYVRWFKAHRTRRRGLPAYVDYRHCRRNWVRDQYVKLRQALIWMLVRFRLKGGPRAP